MGSVVSTETWDGWLDRMLPPAEAGPAPRWMQAMAKRHAALSAEVKALYDTDYLGVGTGNSFWDSLRSTP